MKDKVSIVYGIKLNKEEYESLAKKFYEILTEKFSSLRPKEQRILKSFNNNLYDENFVNILNKRFTLFLVGKSLEYYKSEKFSDFSFYIGIEVNNLEEGFSYRQNPIEKVDRRIDNFCKRFSILSNKKDVYIKKNL